MNHRVVWLPDAEQELAAIWINATDRTAVTKAANKLDGVLIRDAENAGESRPDGRRVIFELPLAAIYRINSDSQTVLVLHVWIVSP